MALHLVQRKGRFGNCLMLANEHGAIIPGLQMLELKEESDSYNTVTMRFLMVPDGIVLGEPEKSAASRIDVMVAEAKAEISRMAERALSRIRGDRIGTYFGGCPPMPGEAGRYV
ncbi:hypothetical protein D9M71_33880 [compost metagenome]